MFNSSLPPLCITFVQLLSCFITHLLYSSSLLRCTTYSLFFFLYIIIYSECSCFSHLSCVEMQLPCSPHLCSRNPHLVSPNFTKSVLNVRTKCSRSTHQIYIICLKHNMLQLSYMYINRYVL